MSYGLVVFDPKSAPHERKAFQVWYDEQGSNDESYNDLRNTTPSLRAWFLDMIKKYPPLNGPYATKDVENPMQSEYSIEQFMIHVGFNWSQANLAYEHMGKLAAKHKLGFYDVSSKEGAVWLPDEKGRYKQVFTTSD